MYGFAILKDMYGVYRNLYPEGSEFRHQSGARSLLRVINSVIPCVTIVIIVCFACSIYHAPSLVRPTLKKRVWGNCVKKVGPVECVN